MKNVDEKVNAHMDDAYAAIKSIKHTVELTLDEVEQVREWYKKSKPMAVIDSGYGLKCPVCKRHVSESDQYCSACGQRVDTGVVAL